MRTIAKSIGLLACAITGLVVPGVAAAKSHTAKIALTFDDLPALTILNDQPYVNYLNETILRALRQNHLPAIGFVNEGKLDEIDRPQQIANLRKWLDAGMNLGNHTFSHESPSSLGEQAYIEDIARGEPVTKALLARHHMQMHWFRHPYLETGFPADVKGEIDRWLGSHGYRIAPVTIDAADWEFAEPYDDAISRHDKSRRLRIRDAYLQYTEEMIEWSRRAANALFDRDISYVMLLHATRLNADCIESLAAMLKRQHLRAVSLENAMRDPAYRIADPYSGRNGIGWLERWSQELHRDLPWGSYAGPPSWIHQEYNRVDNDQQAAPSSEATN